MREVVNGWVTNQKTKKKWERGQRQRGDDDGEEE